MKVTEHFVGIIEAGPQALSTAAQVTELSCRKERGSEWDMEVLPLTVSVLFMQHPRVNRLEKQGIAVAGGRKGKERTPQSVVIRMEAKILQRSDSISHNLHIVVINMQNQNK